MCISDSLHRPVSTGLQHRISRSPGKTIFLMQSTRNDVYVRKSIVCQDPAPFLKTCTGRRRSERFTGLAAANGRRMIQFTPRLSLAAAAGQRESVSTNSPLPAVNIIPNNALDITHNTFASSDLKTDGSSAGNRSRSLPQRSAISTGSKGSGILLRQTTLQRAADRRHCLFSVSSRPDSGSVILTTQ